MGNTDSAQQLGERVINARRKLEEDQKAQTEKSEFFKSKSPESIKVMVNSIEEAFETCSPFLESVLLVVWSCEPEKCKDIVLKSCTKVLKAPIIKSEYEWFEKYVFKSSIWMFEIRSKRFMYQELLEIANNMSSNIVDNMDNIYKHLELHWKWKELMNIKNQTLVSRQDHAKVGLIQEKGIRNILEIKDDNSEEMKTFLDSNVAVNILTTTAKNMNDEFQNHISTAMSRYGNVVAGPIKQVDRCRSKLENDYQNAHFPTAAKLLDLVRCSVTFNTLGQLIDGYNGLISHIQKNSNMIELSRVKNGFLDPERGGYRDIKVNVIYHSQINFGVSMICEIQLLFGQYLHEKKSVHKLYNILRQNEYFKMVVTDEDESKTELKNIKDLKLTPVFNMTKDAHAIKRQGGIQDNVFRCCMDSDSKLVAVEGWGWYGCIDTIAKKAILEEKTDMTYANRQTCNWITVKNQKYLSIKTAKNTIKMFKLIKKNNSYSLQEDKTFGIKLSSSDKIICCEYDKNFENVMIVKNGNILEKRSVNNINVVKKSIKLEQNVEDSYSKLLSLSNDGNFCVLAGGENRKFFYIVDIENNLQTKFQSQHLYNSKAPCFINGEPNFVAIVGGSSKNIEIWDVVKKEAVKRWEVDDWTQATTSINNILALASGNNGTKMIRLYDVRNWEMFYSQEFNMSPASIHLTSDSEYVTIGGSTANGNGERCLIFKIQ